VQSSSGAASLRMLRGQGELVASESGCLSDATGAFACVCNATGGDLTFSVNSALVDFEFTSDCSADTVTNVEASLTTAAATDSGQLAVITGDYDKVESILANMLGCGTLDADGDLDFGTECSRLHIFDGGARISADDQDPNNGDTTYRTASDLLTNADLMDDYAVILLNCGLDESLTVDDTVLTNLQNFVNNGGKIYASDWAYRYLEHAFPALIDFYGDLSTDGLGETIEADSARAGASGTVTVNVEDASVLTYLRENSIIGAADTTADVDFDLSSWVVMSDAAESVTQLLTADALTDPADAVLAGNTTLPIATLSCDDTAGGGIFYASYHTEISSASDADTAQEAILRYMILNGFNACL